MSAWKSTTLTLGHSPDPDDAFMFYAMAENKIDLKGYRFTHILEDIQTLNERATRGELHITALSIHALAYVLDRYALLPSGASMGDGYGPVFITKDSHGLSEGADDLSKKDWLRGKTIAVPGRMTSAFLAAQLFLGQDFDYIVVPFDEIFETVYAGEASVGLIIHEGQLTKASKKASPVSLTWESGGSGRASYPSLSEATSSAKTSLPRSEVKLAKSCAPAFVMRSNIAHRPSPTAWLTREGWISHWRTSSSGCTSTSLPSITAKKAGSPSRGS
jgi:hypothetical protein